MRRRNIRLSLGANLIGAVITFAYFNYVDDVGAADGPPRAGDIAFFVVALGLLVGAGAWLGLRWTCPLAAHAAAAGRAAGAASGGWPGAATGPDAAAGHRAAGVCRLGAGRGRLGVVRPLLTGTFTPKPRCGPILGTTVIAGVATTVLIFLAVERQWRPALSAYFPGRGPQRGPRRGADPRAHPPARRLSPRSALRPPLLLGVIAYTRASDMLGADPEAAAGLVRNLVVAIAVITALGIATSIALSLHVARSVADPLRDVERAMDGAARADLEQRVAGLSTDEIGAVAEGFNRMVQGLPGARADPGDVRACYVTPEIRDEILAGRLELGGPGPSR